jgi:thiol-disulfide isomerase/thioredoxin
VSQRPTLYNFTADWCPFCRRLERDLFADPDSAVWLAERYVPVRVLDREREDGRNSDEVAALKAKFEVKRFPTLIVVSSDGAVVARHEGYGGNLREVRGVLAGASSSTARR